MMYKEMRKKAKKKVQAKMGFYICAVVFFFVSILLLMLSSYLPSVGFWLRLPIPIFVMVLGILYLAAFGMPYHNALLSEDWQEEEIEKEILKLYRRKKTQLPPPEELSETEVLELKELERLEEKWDLDDGYV